MTIVDFIGVTVAVWLGSLLKEVAWRSVGKKAASGMKKLADRLPQEDETDA